MTFKDAFNEYDTKSNQALNDTGIFYAFSTEQFNNNKTKKDASVYNDLWIELDNWCKNNFNDNELKYYYSTTD